ncbi:aspartate aminotransferase [Peptostreptococcaceae bacterium pGA-8]|nr:aspartate aminotransferase [Peptostreptococcaceae bacterium pGA-8]
MHKLMTAGPTMVRENVMEARSKVFTNPDLDKEFFDFYKETCGLLSMAAHTENEAYILGGEGILGLEAACAALTEPGDRVLVIDNGIFGRGFDGFVKIYGGEPLYFESDYRRPVNVDELKAFLENDSNFKYATLVHCDTPSGVINDVMNIGNLLKEYGILTVVDTVAGIFGEYINMDQSKIDILCGGSQKALSAPPGLTMLWLSDDAWEAIENRRTPIASFYANIALFKDYYEKKGFPYTMPVSDIMGLRVALENVFADQDILGRHRKIAMAVRGALRHGNLKLYLEEGWANTVTAFEVPEGIDCQALLDKMKDDYGVMLSGSLGCLYGKVVRIGHMGENATVENLRLTFDALGKALTDLGYEIDGDMSCQFSKLMD